MLWPNPTHEMQRPRLQSLRGRTMVSLRFIFLLHFAWIGFAWSVFVRSAKAQVVLNPGGDYESDFEKVLVVMISLVLLLVAARYSYRNGQLDFAVNWFAERVRRIFRRWCADGAALVQEFPCGNFRETCSTSLGRRRWNRCHRA